MSLGCECFSVNSWVSFYIYIRICYFTVKLFFRWYTDEKKEKKKQKEVPGVSNSTLTRIEKYYSGNVLLNILNEDWSEPVIPVIYAERNCILNTAHAHKLWQRTMSDMAIWDQIRKHDIFMTP